MSKLLMCPNCTEPVSKPHKGCLLHDLINVVRERGNTPEARLRKLHATVYVENFWDDVGRIVDYLEDGLFSD